MIQVETWNKRNEEFTFKYNTKLGRHGWLRLTPAYSVRVVREVMESYESRAVILDPFCGTGTTPLVLAESGHQSSAYDVNPFLVWFATAKVAQYSDCDLETIITTIENLQTVPLDDSASPWLPSIHNIHRWWSPRTLNCLGNLHHLLTTHYGHPASSNGPSCLPWIAFARLIIETSSAAFNHVSMSFKDETVSHDSEVVQWHP
jgi:hypothetical protein